MIRSDDVPAVMAGDLVSDDMTTVLTRVPEEALTLW